MIALEDRIADVGWTEVESDLDARGWAVVRELLRTEECAELTSLYDDDTRFRSRVVMSRHGFGRGEYKYFAHPLPPTVSTLRERLYPRLVPLANRWHELLRSDVRFPPAHADFVERCRAAGQERPTPLLLRYGTGDYNCLHQDLYGEHVFPLQVALLLDEPGRGFDGGELVLTEQRPRMQSRPMVLSLHRGDAAIFAVNHRPVIGARGAYRVSLRHGVSALRSGSRHTLGVIFHDAP